MSDKESLFKVMLDDYFSDQYADMRSKIDKAIRAAAVDDNWNGNYDLIKSVVFAILQDKCGEISHGSHSKKIIGDAKNIRKIM